MISGRGNDVERVNLKKTLYLNVVDNIDGVSALDSYAMFDELKIKSNSATEKALKAIKEKSGFYKYISNDLTKGSVKLMPNIQNAINILKLADGKTMTGSGSAVIGVYDNPSKRNLEYLILNKTKKIYKLNTI